jgi:hypothetical protein
MSANFVNIVTFKDTLKHNLTLTTKKEHHE